MCSFAPVSRANEQRALDRFEFGDDGPRREEVARAAAASSRCASARVISSLSACTATGSPSRAASRMPVEQRLIVGARKLRQPRVAHERLEADDAAGGHLRHLGDGTRHESAPQRRSR